MNNQITLRAIEKQMTKSTQKKKSFSFLFRVLRAPLQLLPIELVLDRSVEHVVPRLVKVLELRLERLRQFRVLPTLAGTHAHGFAVTVLFCALCDKLVIDR